MLGAEELLIVPTTALLTIHECLRLEASLKVPQGATEESPVRPSPWNRQLDGKEIVDASNSAFVYDVGDNSFSFHSPVGPVEGTYGDEEEQLHTEEKSFQHRTGVGDETIEWSSREEDAKDQEKVLKPISKKSAHAKGKTTSPSRRTSFLVEDTLEEISDFIDTNEDAAVLIDSFEESGSQKKQGSRGEEGENEKKLTSHFARMMITTTESAFPINNTMDRKEKEYLKWLQCREKTNEGAIAAYTSSSSSSGMIRNLSLAVALSAHTVVKEEQMKRNEYEKVGGTLVVTTKPLVEEWLKVASGAAGGSVRYENYTTSLNKRRFLRVNKKAVDVVVTTWDILKAKEEHGERSRLHSLSWLNVIVDFGNSRTPTERNMDGRAIQAVEAQTMVALVEATLDSSRIGKDPLMTEAFLRNTIRALLRMPNSVPLANLLFDGRIH